MLSEIETTTPKMPNLEDKPIRVQMDLEHMETREMPTLDMRQYIGRRVRIATLVTEMGKYGYYIKALTEVIETLPSGIQIYASKIYKLFVHEDAPDKPFIGKGSLLEKDMQLLRAKNPGDMYGREVIIQTVTNKKAGKTYLTW